MNTFQTHSSHWGAFSGRYEDGKLEIRPHPADANPSPLLGNLAAVADSPVRIRRPAVRRGWLEGAHGNARKRGADDYVEVSWPQALDLVANELRRVYADFGPRAVFGGSYGWSSAGRFHHAQSQIHRFLNVLGGYVRSVNTYSSGAAMVVIPHVLGPYDHFDRKSVSWNAIERSSELVVAFGGMAIKNTDVHGGGISAHIVPRTLNGARARGARFVLVSPLKDDFPAELDAQWLPVVPGTDVALMLGLAHVLVSEGLHDRGFLDRYTVGYEYFEAYLLGRSDGVAKSPEWASGICGIAADVIRTLARTMACARTLITISHSLQRADYGEQPVWMGIVLAAMLGQIGLDGGGYSYSLGALGNIGKSQLAVPLPTLSQFKNPVPDFIPVARIADMLLQPGDMYHYNGQALHYPDIRLVYWAGGNPFHHHQDLNRLRAAFKRPETIIVHEAAWTSSARHADIVLPATTTLERDDIGAADRDPLMIAMKKLIEPVGEARDDYEIFSGIARRLGTFEEFTENRTSREWLALLFETTRKALAAGGHHAPDFETFWEKGELRLPLKADDGGPARAFRDDPVRSPLQTPSGKIEIFSQTIESFGYDDCRGHPQWYPARTEAGADQDHPFHLICNQPHSRLHSQLDYGDFSRSTKIKGREPVRINPADAAERGIADGDIVRLFNSRGSCLAAAVMSEDVRSGVLQLATGAWFEPDDPAADRAMCIHGNPNILTRDIGTSQLAQASTGQLTRVQIERFDGEPPPVRIFEEIKFSDDHTGASAQASADLPVLDGSSRVAPRRKAELCERRNEIK
ncbi:molybdopterin guanine dinucleotide-containing S/N-oxide reductase [Rhizobium lentis]|uniref:molybdopterin guanine dinucleotide-containing S/N-oxide reductase n=1 Tax=Rhizobium lentis TaxID=1138194 RepID=UPI001C831B61|nr:molybdopterin guanine dinucleotide-containing S/N-oxide reductase [Rhizobium lentis]MBX5050067.1 molybdopterin-dependent oxidoreductase [Rhizobium lentis]MBX5061745.1 molybdopterin-dependent oxidoreductase [Rhizobium lentis]MBX5145519.1 molybdopterin-dependent oxidoreductase [Rhizobium lentis]